MTHAAKNRYWGSVTPPTSKTEFFDAVASPAPAGDGTVATIRMYGPVDSWGGWWGISASDVSDVLDELPDSVSQIILRINSPGGEVWEALSILNMLRAHSANVVAVVDGLAASAASFIAVGCDETVMSPGTQMMIHSPLAWAYGNGVDLRKTAETLDSIEESIISIYQDKAGDADWPSLLADTTWYTAAQAVDAGLADRVAVVKDAGDTLTAGADDEPEPLPESGDVEDRFTAARARLASFAARAAAPNLPDSTEPGTPNRKDEAMAYGDLQAGLRERLGVTDAAVSDDELLAAVDEALAEQADTTPAAPVASAALPEGTVAIDKAVLAEMQEGARQGAAARAEQDRTRRDGIITNALQTGRITAASHDEWRARLDKDEDGFAAVLNSLPENIVPVAEIGHQAAASDDAYPAHYKR